MTRRLRWLGMAALIGMIALFALAPTAGAAPLAQATDTVDAADQAISNGSIVVAEVNASQAGWIAVHIDQGGKPGAVIGHAAAPKGKTSNLTVKLEQDVPAGGKVWPMLHIDAGAIGTYEFPGSDAPVVVGGNIVMKQISITAATAAPAKPTTLPTTGGESLPIGLLVSALAILIAGSLLKLRSRA